MRPRFAIMVLSAVVMLVTAIVTLLIIFPAKPTYFQQFSTVDEVRQHLTPLLPLSRSTTDDVRRFVADTRYDLDCGDWAYYEVTEDIGFDTALPCFSPTSNPAFVFFIQFELMDDRLVDIHVAPTFIGL